MNCRALRVVLQAIQCKPFIVELAVQVIVMCFGSPVPLLTSMNLAHFVFTYEPRQLWCFFTPSLLDAGIKRNAHSLPLQNSLKNEFQEI